MIQLASFLGYSVYNSRKDAFFAFKQHAHIKKIDFHNINFMRSWKISKCFFECFQASFSHENAICEFISVL